MRAVPEWIGTSDDQAIPQRVRLRVFEAHGGKCALSGRKIRAGDKWQIDHRLALANGGQHRENNLQPVLVGPHQEKTAEDLAQRVKTDRVRAKHLGIWARPKRRLQGRGFQKTPQIAGASSRDEP